MRILIRLLLDIYLFPLRINRRLALFVKGIVIPKEEHFLITADVIRRKTPNGTGVIIDAGAFNGDSTIFFAKEFPGNAVIGFEPNPKPFGLAVGNCAKFPNVKMENKGLGSFKGQTAFHLTNDLVSSSIFAVASTDEFFPKEVVNVELTTLDDYTAEFESILLLKMDVQGAELEILKGGTDALRKTKFVLTEALIANLYHGGCKYFEVDQALRDKGFRIYSIISNYNNQGTRYFDVLYFNMNYCSD